VLILESTPFLFTTLFMELGASSLELDPF